MPKATRRQIEKTEQLERSIIDERLEHTRTGGKKRACFVVMGGLDVGSVFNLDKDVMVLGRDPSCDLMLKDDGISRRHVEVRRTGEDQLSIKDLNSTNGTFVDGERIQEATLLDGGKVLLGRRTVLKFVLYDQLEQSYQKQIYESSTLDGLTGVYNRKYFTQKMLSDLSFAKRHQIPFSLLMLDIDFFKKINDTFGHRTGDKVLMFVTSAIDTIIRTEDVLARYGGEEFAVIAQGTDLKGGHSLAERIRMWISGEKLISLSEPPKTFRVTVSIGVATVPPGVAATPETVISAADKNLYAAKESGRNRVVSSELK